MHAWTLGGQVLTMAYEFAQKHYSKSTPKLLTIYLHDRWSWSGPGIDIEDNSFFFLKYMLVRQPPPLVMNMKMDTKSGESGGCGAPYSSSSERGLEMKGGDRSSFNDRERALIMKRER